MAKNTYNKRVSCKTVLFLFILVFTVSKNYGQKKLLEAIEKRDTATFDSILASGANVNKRKTSIYTRYGISRKRKLKGGKIVVDKSRRKGIPLIYIKRTELPLTEAAFNENYYFVSELLKNGAKPNKRKNLVLPPLAWASHRGQLEIVKLLLDYKADINGSERKGRTTPLIEAIEWKHWEIAKFLIGKGADINLTDQYGQTGLSHAAIHKNPELVKILVERGADVNHKSHGGTSILENSCSDDRLFAEEETSFEVVKYLVERGAKVDNDAIKKILSKGEFEIAKYLFSKGAPVSNGLVLSAANGRNYEMFRYLIDTMNLDIHYRDKTGYWGENVLHRVCTGYWESSARNINVPMLEYILGKKVSVNDTNARGESPILLVQNGSNDHDVRDGVALLIKKGARVNVSGGSMSFSPLMHAASDKHPETAKLLIQNSANVNARDYEGKTILHWASWTYRNEEIIKLLVLNGADVNAKDSRGDTPAMGCVIFGRNENIKAMIELGLDLNIKNNSGYTLLDLISDEEVKALLKSKGAKSGKEIK